MVAFIDDHREQFGVEPICRVPPIAPSTYFGRKGEQRNPTRRSTRAQGDDVLRAIIRRVRGRAWTTTTQAGPDLDPPRDLVDRQFAATRPNQRWVSDFTDVATWRGFVYVAFVIDVFARRIVGWHVSSSLVTDFAWTRSSQQSTTMQRRSTRIYFSRAAGDTIMGAWAVA